MTNLHEQVISLANALGRKAADLEDGAAYAYITAQAEALLDRGEDLTEYVLIRSEGNYEIEGSKFIGKVRYGLLHKSKVIDVRLGADEEEGA